jgi:hypothetical protein
MTSQASEKNRWYLSKNANTDSESASLILQRDFEDSKALTAYGASFSMRTDYGTEILSIAHCPVADCYVPSINRG